LKSMLPVLKRAKTSETQRLIKKIKFLRKKSEGTEEATQSAKQELADLEQQLDIIKVCKRLPPQGDRVGLPTLCINVLTALRTQLARTTPSLLETSQTPSTQTISTFAGQLLPRVNQSPCRIVNTSNQGGEPALFLKTHERCYRSCRQLGCGTGRSQSEIRSQQGSKCGE
jgi:hypothetical protein